MKTKQIKVTGKSQGAWYSDFINEYLLATDNGIDGYYVKFNIQSPFLKDKIYKGIYPSGAGAWISGFIPYTKCELI